MKIRLPIIIIALAIMALFWGIQEATAEGLHWDLPGGIGTIQLPVNPTDILPVIGYDFVQKEAIAGAAASLITLFKEINGYAGGVGSFNTKGPFGQPYLAIGSDFARYVPVLRQVQNLQVHAFVRYVPSGTNEKNYGSGLSIAYKFGPPTPPPPQAASEPPGPPAPPKSEQ